MVTIRDDDEDQDDVGKILAPHLAALMEHFQCVHIFVMKDNSESTDIYDQGKGNFYARMAQIREFILVNDERAREHVRQHDRRNSDDNDDDYGDGET